MAENQHSKWENECLFCDEKIVNFKNWNPPEDDPGMNIGHNLSSHGSDCGKDYIVKYLPNLENSIYQFPECWFHNQPDEGLRRIGMIDIESDQMNDKCLKLFLHQKSIESSTPMEERADSIVRADVCRKIYLYAMKIDAYPSLILSNYAYPMYIRRYGGGLDGHCKNIKFNDHSHSTRIADCAWVMPSKNVFGISINSINENINDIDAQPDVVFIQSSNVIAF